MGDNSSLVDLQRPNWYVLFVWSNQEKGLAVLPRTKVIDPRRSCPMSWRSNKNFVSRPLNTSELRRWEERPRCHQSF